MIWGEIESLWHTVRNEAFECGFQILMNKIILYNSVKKRKKLGKREFKTWTWIADGENDWDLFVVFRDYEQSKR